MSDRPRPLRVFQSRSSLECAIVGGLTFLAFSCVTLESAQVSALGTLFCAFAGYVMAGLQEAKENRQKWNDTASLLPVPFELASVPGFLREYLALVTALKKIVQHNDLLFHELSRTRLEEIAKEVTTMARGEIVFDATETWRAAYQSVLETLHVKVYYSAAWVRTNDYWNDAPGRQSIRFNYDLMARGFHIERVHILSDELWPFDARVPMTAILEWLVEQQGQGIQVSLVREADLMNEPDLLCDFAVYGDRAMGIQQLDEQSRTQRFVLSFDQQAVRQALARWERLKLFSISLQNLMDPMQG
jgi:hypothetical protein